MTTTNSNPTGINQWTHGAGGLSKKAVELSPSRHWAADRTNDAIKASKQAVADGHAGGHSEASIAHSMAAAAHRTANDAWRKAGKKEAADAHLAAATAHEKASNAHENQFTKMMNGGAKPTSNTECVFNRLAVNKARREQLHGREHVVVPMSMIVPGVLNGSKGALYYPIEEVQKDPTPWNGMPITVGHPVRNGKNVSARDPEVLDSQSIGTVLKARTGDKLRAEAWIDVIKANRIDPRIIENIDQGRKTEISTGLYTDNTAAPEGSHHRGKPYQWIARNYRPDHLAILVDQRGACSVDDGCGLGVNALNVNSNPEGHNQYTHGSKFKVGDRIHVAGKNGGVVTRQGSSKIEVLHDASNVATIYKHEDKRLRSTVQNSNPEGHNQYTAHAFGSKIKKSGDASKHVQYWVAVIKKNGEVIKAAPGARSKTQALRLANEHIAKIHAGTAIMNQELQLTPYQKKQIVIDLTANEGCGCWQKSDRKHLMTFSDERLLELKASHDQEVVDNGGPGSGPQKSGTKHLEQHLAEGDRVKIHPAYGLKGVHTVTAVHQDSFGRRTHAVVQKGSKKSTISTADISHHESAETGKRSKIVGNSRSVFSKQECNMLSEKANNSSALAEKSERETDHERAGQDHEDAKHAHMNRESGADTDTAAEHSKKAQSHFGKSKANDNEKLVSTENQQGEQFVPNENSGQMTEEQFMDMAPDSIRETINNAAEIVRETKKALIDKLTANMQGEEKTQYVAYLSAKPLPEVRQLVALVANATPAPATQVQSRQSVYGPTGGSVVVDNRAEDTDVLDMTPMRIDWKTLSASNANNRSRN